MSALAAFHFLQPSWLLLLLALPALLWLAARRDPARQQLSRLVDAELLAHLLRGRPRRRALPLGLLALGWLLTCLALAGPTWSRAAQPLYAQRAAQVVALSLSRHMLSQDQPPSRLDRARYKARALLEANRDGLNGLIAYAGQSFVVAPLTEDASALNDLLDALAPDTMPVDGDDAAAAIAQGVDLIGHAKAGGGSLVLITDQADAAAIDAARRALAAGVHVSVLGVGTAHGAPLPNGDGSFVRDARGDIVLAPRDERALTALAAAGGGRYVPLSDSRADIDALHAQLRVAQPVSSNTQTGGDAWQDRGPWLLLVLLPLAALGFRRGWLLALPLLLAPMLWSAPAQAEGWRDLWLRPDQQAARALQQGNAQQAQQLARDPALRGAAAYRAGDYAAAAEALQQAGGADADYNLGNTHAKQGDYQAALDAYDRALKRDPHNADALANRQAVQDWLKQHPPKDNPDQRGQGGKGGHDSKNSPGQQTPSSGQSSQGQGQQDQQNQQGQQQGQQGQQQGQQGQQNQQGQDPNSAGRSAQGHDPSQDRSGKPDGQSGQDKSASAPPPTAQQQAEQQAEQQAKTAQAQQALRQQLDQALADKAKAGQAHQLGTLDAGDPQAKLPPELRQALQRVPDDPGALLRRKFELEYRQRQGDAAPEDGQP